MGVDDTRALRQTSTRGQTTTRDCCRFEGMRRIWQRVIWRWVQVTCLHLSG